MTEDEVKRLYDVSVEMSSIAYDMCYETGSISLRELACIEDFATGIATADAVLRSNKWGQKNEAQLVALDMVEVIRDVGRQNYTAEAVSND